MLIDTHAHLWFDEYENDLEQVMARAKAAGVEKMIVPGTNLESSNKAVELAKKYPGILYAAVGIHPEELVNSSKVRPSAHDISRGWALPSRSDLEGAVAIGEIGTDQYNKLTSQQTNEQMKLFKTQCELALEFDLPVIIHTRNSLKEALEVLDGLKEMPRGQFHCFSHDEDGLKQVLARGFFVSFGGNITWSKRVAKLVALVRDDRLLLETDSPLMVPRDKDGNSIGDRKRNEPANVKILAEKIAELRGQNCEEVEKYTSFNANRLYKL